ncbi:hypothetical protein KFK09_022747 [Dendrobium nobile]|uniref:Uncharacterized protein n=1 Tax=Dendrobium nobile TaxID=94219 RepID=A0A8T3AKB0_DENNO|nr:hypothetical protein KFK09_022747 [Dendrobium nobile]
MIRKREEKNCCIRIMIWEHLLLLYVKLKVSRFSKSALEDGNTSSYAQVVSSSGMNSEQNLNSISILNNGMLGPLNVDDIPGSNNGEIAFEAAASSKSEIAENKPLYIKVVSSEFKPNMMEDGVAVKLHLDNEENNINQLQNSIVVKVFGNSISFAVISSELHKQWSHLGVFNLTNLGRCCVHSILNKLRRLF